MVGDALQETSFLAEDKERWGSGQKTSQTNTSCERKALGPALSAHRIRVTSVVSSTADPGSLLGPAAGEKRAAKQAVLWEWLAHGHLNWENEMADMVFLG